MKQFIIVGLIFFISCAGDGKYLTYSGLKPDAVTTRAHYIGGGAGSDIYLAAMIRSGGVMGVFYYDFLVINNGNEPLNMNYVYDVIFLIIDGKKFKLSKFTSIDQYPDDLNPDTYNLTKYTIPKRFNDNVNDIEQLIFQHNSGTEYILLKNPNATWE
jgi:hypothetical protein